MRRIRNFLKMHWLVASSLSAAAASIIALLFGQGFLFKLGDVDRDQLQLESQLAGQLREYEKDIYDLVPQYVTVRDRRSNETPHEEDLEYRRLRAQLIALFLIYNKNEARLSRLEERGAQLMLPASVIPPRPPRITSVVTVPGPAGSEQSHERVSWVFQDDEVVIAVNQQLELLLQQYDDSFLNAAYLQSCKAKHPQFCTQLATRLAGPNPTRLAPDVHDLYQRGCAYGDPVACQALAFAEFHRKNYVATEQWLRNACALRSGDGCGFLGSLQVSKLLGQKRNARLGQENLEKGCELNSERSCYYLALVYVSGLVDRDEVAAIARLEEACHRGLDEACKSLSKFEDFRACSPTAIYPLGGEASLTIDCNASN